MNRVPASGPRSAKILILGEAPGEYEERLGAPFVGPSGHKLTIWIRAAGLDRSQCRMDNVYPFRPPGNEIWAVSRDELQAWATDVHRRVSELPELRVLVPVGTFALRALLRRDVTDTDMSIVKYRGSILPYQDGNRQLKLIPTIHPASLYHARAKRGRGQKKSNPGTTEKHSRRDWLRVAEEVHNDLDPPTPPRAVLVESSNDCVAFRQLFDSLPRTTPLTIDIETPTGAIDVVGFAWTTAEAYVVTLRHPGRTVANVEERWALVRYVCESANPKILQNGQFDIYWLWFKEGIRVNSYAHDCMALAHMLDPIEDFDLATMKSLHLRGSYHKDEAKSPEKIKRYASHFDALVGYNAMDCVDQVGLYETMRRKLTACGRYNVYTYISSPMLEPLTRLALGGMRVDRERRRLRYVLTLARTIELQEEIADLVGAPLHKEKDISNKLLGEYLYGDLGLPRQYNRETSTTTVDERTLLKLALKHPQCAPLVSLVLQHRRHLKLTSFLSDGAVDDDDYFRSCYSMTTETGRLSSSKNPFGTGGNAQNIDREIRDTFVPDRQDHVFLELDLSQAESRLVYVLSGDLGLYELACRPPAEFDQHRYNAAKIFGIAESEVTPEQRYLGKRIVHGVQRRLQGETMSDNLLTDGFVRSKRWCQEKIDAYLREHPGVIAYYEWIEDRIIYDGRLTNAWGFVWDVTYEQKTNELYRRAYSFVPQSNVAFLMNVNGFLVADALIRQRRLDARVVNHSHDSILVSCDPSCVEDLVKRLTASLSSPITYETRTGPKSFSMPVVASVGDRWGELVPLR